MLSLKPSLFALARQNRGKDANELFGHFRDDDFVDKLALHTTDSYIHGRDQVIVRQQEEMLELSTPVVTLWDGIVALPLIGTLDSARTQVVMESLLQAIVQTNSRICHHRYYRRAHRRYAGRPASAQDHHRGPIDGRRMHP